MATAAVQLPSGQLHSTIVAGAGDSRVMNLLSLPYCRSFLNIEITKRVYISWSSHAHRPVASDIHLICILNLREFLIKDFRCWETLQEQPYLVYKRFSERVQGR